MMYKATQDITYLVCIRLPRDPVTDNKGGGCVDRKWLSWWFDPDGRPGYCQYFILFNLGLNKKTETIRTWQNYTHSYINHAFSTFKGINLDKPNCKWIYKNFKIFQGGGIIVCTLITLFEMPDVLCKYMENAAEVHYYFLKRAYINMPAVRYHTGRFIIA